MEIAKGVKFSQVKKSQELRLKQDDLVVNSTILDWDEGDLHFVVIEGFDSHLRKVTIQINGACQDGEFMIGIVHPQLLASSQYHVNKAQLQQHGYLLSYQSGQIIPCPEHYQCLGIFRNTVLEVLLDVDKKTLTFTVLKGQNEGRIKSRILPWEYQQIEKAVMVIGLSCHQQFQILQVQI